MLGELFVTSPREKQIYSCNFNHHSFYEQMKQIIRPANEFKNVLWKQYRETYHPVHMQHATCNMQHATCKDPVAVSVKILHLGKFSPFFQGGIETFLHDLNNALSKKQHLISDVLCFDESQTAIPKKASYNIYRSTIDFTISNAPVSIDYLKWLKKHIHHYHIVHVHHPNPIANLGLLLSDFKGKVIVHWHSDIVKQSLL